MGTPATRGASLHAHGGASEGRTRTPARWVPHQQQSDTWSSREASDMAVEAVKAQSRIALDQPIALSLMAQSTLDLLELDDAHEGDYAEEDNDPALREDGYVDDSGRHPHPETAAAELFMVHGEATGTSRSKRLVSKKKPRPAAATRKPNGTSGNNQSAHAIARSADGSKYHEQNGEKIQALEDRLGQLQRELEHTREERDEIQAAFRRLDKEIGSGYNLTERKEKELRIAELLTKNQKLSAMLEKELKAQEALRVANAELQSHTKSLDEQLRLVKRVLASVESKHAALEEANGKLVAEHERACERITLLQEELTLSHAQHNTLAGHQAGEYEVTIRVLEARCAEWQRKADDRGQMLRAEQDRSKALEADIERWLEEKTSLEQEVAEAHDQLIAMNGTMRAMEAKAEAATSKKGDASVETMMQRIRLLEEERETKNRLIADLKESIDSMLSTSRHNISGTKRVQVKRPPQSKPPESFTNKIVTLSQRLRSAEEARDHKSRSLDVLIAVLPSLLQHIDALQDKFSAAIESNTILTHAIEQLQSGDNGDPDLHHQPAVAVAREKYLLSGPYQPELLMGYTASCAFHDIAPTPHRNQTKSLPFLVKTSARSTYSQDTHKTSALVVAADADDPSGAAFLNRSKINAFLSFIQGRAAQVKVKPLLVQKIAELLSAHRDLLHQHSSDTAFYKISIANLQREVQQLRVSRERAQDAVEKLQQSAMDHASGHRVHCGNLLVKIIDLMAERYRAEHKTFVTQLEEPSSSDILVHRAEGSRSSCGSKADSATLDLSYCNLSDQDLEMLLLKLSVCGLHLQELRLDHNSLTDAGAAILGAHVEMTKHPFTFLSLLGNDQITADGVTKLRNALSKLPHVHRVEMDMANQKLRGVSLSNEFNHPGQVDIVVEIVLPSVASVPPQDVAGVDQDRQVESLIKTLDNMGYCDTASSLARAETVYRQPRLRSSKKQPPSRHIASTRKRIINEPRASKQMSQKELKFRALEAAIRRAEKTPSHLEQETPGITLSQMQFMLKHASHSAVVVPSSRRITKLNLAQSHLATIRGLSKK